MTEIEDEDPKVFPEGHEDLVEDWRNQAKEWEDRSKAIEQELIAANARQEVADKRRNLLILLVLLALVASTIVQHYRAVYVTGPKIENTNELVTKIDDAQSRDIDTLVSFVEEYQSTPRPAIDVQLFIDLLCASEDPVRVQACNSIQVGSTEG